MVTNEVLDFAYSLLETKSKIERKKITDEVEIENFRQQKEQFQREYPDVFPERFAAS